MKINLTSFVIFVISLSHLAVLAQSNYKEGQVIKINGDTLKGYIDNRSARFINFKTNLTGEAVKYEPEELISYYVGSNQYYVTKDIQFNVAQKVVSRKIFLEALEWGRASLYYFKEPAGEEHFYIEKDTLFKRIKSETSTITNEEGKTYLHADKRYMGFINSIFKDCPSWKSTTDYEFEENALKRAVRRYNNCFASASGKPNKRDTATTHKEKVKIGYIVQAGLNHSTVIQSGGPVPNSELQHPVGQFGFTGGIALDIIFPRINNNLSLQLELNYSQKGVSDSGSHIVSPFYPSYAGHTKTRYNMSFLDLVVMAKYSYPKGRFRPYIGLGFEIGYLINKNDAFKVTTTKSSTTGDTIPVTTNSNMHDVSLSMEIGFCGEIGLVVPIYKNNKLVFSIRYERSKLLTNGAINTINFYNDNGFPTFYPYSYTVEQFQFKVGYRFK